MGIRPSVKGCKTDLVDQHIGDAYDVVKLVYDNLEAIKDIAKFIEQEINHTLLSGRDNPNQHPISSITGLIDVLQSKQDLLQSGVNIRTINGESLLGSSDVPIRHDTLQNKDAADQHLISSITGLTEELERISNYNQTVGIDVITTTSNAINVSSVDNSKHYACTSNNLVNVVLGEALSTEATGKGVVVFFTQVGEGTIHVSGDSGIELIYPTENIPATFDKGSTIAALSISKTQWVITGNLGY